jgi:hypothetical protein
MNTNNFINKIYQAAISIAVLILLLCSRNGIAETIDKKEIQLETINFTVTVLDYNTSQPLQLVTIILKQNNSIIATGTTNPFGRAVFDDIESGEFIISARYLGYEHFTDSISIDTANRAYLIKLKESTVELNEINVRGERINNVPTSIDMHTGQQVFEGENYHAAPTASMTQLIQQNLAGAAKAPTGEVHIRGQHGEFSYLIDGIPVPLGVFGGLNEIVDPKVISKVSFLTAGFPAEFGGQITGLMDVQTRIPSGKFHLDLSTYGGSYLTSNNDTLGSRVGTLKALNLNGQSFSVSDHLGKLGYFIEASREETDRRIDQPVQQLFQDHGFDYFTYGKFDYLLNEDDYITANINYSRTVTQVPYDPVEGYLSDQQNSYNGFQTLSFFHVISHETDHESNLFIGGFAREGGLDYIPSVFDNNPTFLGTDTVNGYVIEQNRSYTTVGLRTKYDNRTSHHFMYAAGLSYSSIFGTENFRFFNANGNGLINSSNFNGYDLAAFAQTEYHPYEWTKLDLGLRYDIHNAPSFSKNLTQLSPRIKWYLFLDDYNLFTISYDRLFMPINIENLGAVASQFGNVTTPTYPEKDNLYEIAYLRNWKNGFNSKLAGFYKESTPGLDDQTLGSSTIRVSVNINRIIVRGIELATTFNQQDFPLSGYINGSIIHAFGTGPVEGGFLPPDSSTAPFDLDHDLRLTSVIGVNYQEENWFLNMNATYTSGLANGNGDYVFKTGLFDFNTGAHTAPAWILDLSSGYTFYVNNGHTLEPSIYINNLLDHAHLIKGAFFSGASFEARRNIMVKLTYHF